MNTNQLILLLDIKRNGLNYANHASFHCCLEADTAFLMEHGWIEIAHFATHPEVEYTLTDKGNVLVAGIHNMHLKQKWVAVYEE